MTNTPHKVRENRLRRAARRQGLRLERSRRRDPRAIGHGTCRLVDTAGNTIVAGGFTGDGYGMDLDDVARALGDAVAAA